VSWDELVAAALVGMERRPVVPQPPPGAPPELAAALKDRGEDGLLAAAAAWTVARRAGAVPGPPRQVEPAPADPRPLCAPAAGARLGWLLDSADDRLLDEWLRLAAGRGLRPPPELVPALLDAAIDDPARQLLAVAAGGPLGAWLAARGSAPTGAAAARPSATARWPFLPGADDPAAVWEHGDPAARELVLRRLRLSDPAAGRELLARTLAVETAEDRARFVGALRTGLGDDDEPLLERVLDDRRQDVRAAAADLLARLPRSRFAARMAERAAGLLALRHRATLAVELPGEPDAATRRDGIPRRARRSEVLAHILAHAPLAAWTERFARSAQEIVALPVGDGFGDLVHGAFAQAALAQRDAAWARALWPRRPELLGVLPTEERERLAAGLTPEQIVAAVPGPWGAELSRAVAATLAAADPATAPRPPVELAYALDPAVLGQLEPLIESGGRPIARLCDVLAIRAAMLRELS
jgi:hypothetical protein